MPALKTYRLFISHSWTYGDAYEKLVKFFDEHPNFTWANYSVPKDDPTLMASPNSPTRGHPKFPQAAPSDYDASAWMTKRAAASLSL